MTANTNTSGELTLKLENVLPEQGLTEYQKNMYKDYLSKFDLTDIMTNVLGMYYGKYLEAINKLYELYEDNKTKFVKPRISTSLKINPILAKVGNRKLAEIYRNINTNNTEYFNKDNISEIFGYLTKRTDGGYYRTTYLLLVKDTEHINNSFVNEKIVKQVFTPKNALDIINYNFNKLASLWNWYQTNIAQIIDYMKRNNDPSVNNIEDLYKYEQKIFRILIEEIDKAKLMVSGNRGVVNYTAKATILYYILEEMNKLTPDLYNTMFSVIYLIYKNIDRFNVRYYLTHKGKQEANPIKKFQDTILQLSGTDTNLFQKDDRLFPYNLTQSTLYLASYLIKAVVSRPVIALYKRSTIRT